MAYLYKFLSENVADVLLDANKKKFGIKFSHLSDYNDPYEFFLTIDYNVPADMLATYKDAISMVVKSPATCFAKSPVILPMWAHYAGNSNGFALEIEESLLEESLEAETSGEFGFGDIDYQDEPHDGMTQTLAMAARRCKPRDMYFLYNAIKSAAYYTKTKGWSYERERRLIVGEEHLKKIAGNLIYYAPVNCVKSIIVGRNASNELKSKVRALALEMGCKYMEMVIGKSSPMPYFKSEYGQSYVFDGALIKAATKTCEGCKEPVALEKLCSWCQMTREHEVYAASTNAFRIFHRAGILDDYLQGMNNITFKK